MSVAIREAVNAIKAASASNVRLKLAHSYSGLLQ